MSSLSLVLSESPFFLPRSEPITGAKINAYASDAAKTTNTVIGRYLINLPDMPGQIIKGEKAASVVSTEANTGANILFAALV